MSLTPKTPPFLPGIRPATRSDDALIARCINGGRKEGFFRGKADVTEASYRAYARSRKAAGHYQAWIISIRGAPAGYMDADWQGSRANVSGLYLAAAQRGRHFGRFLLRYALAFLREAGVSTVTLEVYSHNQASRRLCEGIGFRAAPSTRAEPGTGRRILVFRKTLPKPVRLHPPYPAYAGLHGENLYLHHEALAAELADAILQIAPRGKVEAILGLGSLGRRFGDLHSDLDLAVVVRGDLSASLWRGERMISGISVDLFVANTDALPPEAWDEGRKQAYQESLLLYSRDNRIAGRLRKILRLGKTEQKREIAARIFSMGWLGFYPRAWANRRRHGYDWILPHDEWRQRGSLPSAHLTIDRVMDMLLQLLFLRNGERVPDPKWRRFLVPCLPRLPPRLGTELARFESASRDERGFDRRSAILRRLIESVYADLAREGLLSGDLYRRFLREAPDYDPNA